MEKSFKIKLLLGFLCSFVPLILVALCFLLRKRMIFRSKNESSEAAGEIGSPAVDLEPEDLMKFAGGESLTVHDILDAPGEVVAKSGYGTLYRASIEQSGAVVLLRFVRPACLARTEEVLPAVRALGAIRHPNVVPLRAMYVGPRGEKLLVHPFYAAGSLKQLLRADVGETHRWDIIYRISTGIAKGLAHLHTGLEKPIVHGNLKSNNILIDVDYLPRLSDFGLHLILNPSAAQEMLEASAAQGYKAPELVKVRDVSKETDIYSFGVILLELLTQKDPVNNSKFLHSKDFHSPSSLLNLAVEHKVSDAFDPELLNHSKDPVNNSKFLHSKDFHSPSSLLNLAVEHKVSDAFDPELLNHSIDPNSTNEQGVLMLFQLAKACCSSQPSGRPDIKRVITRLEDIVK